jgi:hypothetical protein
MGRANGGPWKNPAAAFSDFRPMNTRSSVNWFGLAALLCAFVIAFFFASAAHAQTADPGVTLPSKDALSLQLTATDAGADTAASVAVSVVRVLSSVLPAKFAGWLVAIASVCGTIGLFTKPIMSAIEGIVRSSPSTADDAVLEKVEHSAAFRVFAWFLDFFTRIKVGPQFTAKPQGTPDA